MASLQLASVCSMGCTGEWVGSSSALAVLRLQWSGVSVAFYLTADHTVIPRNWMHDSVDPSPCLFAEIMYTNNVLFLRCCLVESSAATRSPPMPFAGSAGVVHSRVADLATYDKLLSSDTVQYSCIRMYILREEASYVPQTLKVCFGFHPKARTTTCRNADI